MTPSEPALTRALDPVRDLLLGSSCLGCHRPGRMVCPGCRAALRDVAPGPAWPTPTPTGLLEPWAAAPYGGLVRALVLGLKERGQLSLASPQAELLAGCVAALLCSVARAAGPAPSWGVVLLVPVPSRRRTVRARGHDATLTVARGAAVRLRHLGVQARAVPLLRLRGGVVDQSGLDAAARRANLAGSMTCPGAGLARAAGLVGAGPGVRVVVCDDVLTTGATVAEAQRALGAVGLPVVGAGVVAATLRRRCGRTGTALTTSGEPLLDRSRDR